MQKVVIFGTGHVGKAIYRKFIESKEHEIVAFIDNNPYMVGKDYKGIRIFSPSEYEKIQFDYIAYAGVWHLDMKAQLDKLGVPNEKIKRISRRELNYSNPQRQKATDEIIKKIDEYLLSRNVKYYIDFSAALFVLRGGSLSEANDVDIYLTNYDDLMLLKDELPKIFNGFKIQISQLYSDTISRKKGDIGHFAMIENTINEGVIIDIGITEEYDSCRLIPWGINTYIHMPKEIFNAGIIRKKYKNLA